MDIIVQLQNELTKRLQKNPSYSVRSFARALDMDQSLLSKILTRRRPPSRLALARFNAILGLGSDVSNGSEKSDETKSAPAKTYNAVKEDQLQVLGTWYHFAILELFKTKGFIPSPKKISERLSLKITETRFALERLERLGFLGRDSRRQLILTQADNCWFNEQMTNAIQMRLQKTYLDQAQTAIELVPYSQRANASLTIAMDPALMGQAKQEFVKFLDRIEALSDKSENKTAVYQVAIAMFPHTAPKKESSHVS